MKARVCHVEEEDIRADASRKAKNVEKIPRSIIDHFNRQWVRKEEQLEGKESDEWKKFLLHFKSLLRAHFVVDYVESFKQGKEWQPYFLIKSSLPLLNLLISLFQTYVEFTNF